MCELEGPRGAQTPPETIQWRVHLRSEPEQVYAALSTAEGRASFWAESAAEVLSEGERHIEFCFSSGQRLLSRVLESTPSCRFRLSYFGGSSVTFELAPTDDGGTDLTLTEENSPADERLQNYAGWVVVLLSLKATLDFGVDLRTHDPGRTWDSGFLDG